VNELQLLETSPMPKLNGLLGPSITTAILCLDTLAISPEDTLMVCTNFTADMLSSRSVGLCPSCEFVASDLAWQGPLT